MDRRYSGLVSVFLIVLAIVFTLGLVFATLEAPRVLNRIVASLVEIPGFHPAIEPQAIEEWMQSNHIRAIGYGCLGILILLTILGIVTERTGLSTLGTVAFFLPTFGHFCVYMFFLGGLGILRILWLPIWDSSVALLKLGDVAYLPYMAVVYPLSQIGVDIRILLAYTLIAVGLFVFLLATITWFYAKFQDKGTVDFWLYRYSRHPQYLGWILWSYGLMLLAAMMPVPMAGTNPGASFPWVISSLLIVSVAYTEEIRMGKERGAEYEAYRESVPFMFPLPRFVSRTITAPMRLLLKTDRPKNTRQVLAMLVIYTIALGLLSLPFVVSKWPDVTNGWAYWPKNLGYTRPFDLLRSLGLGHLSWSSWFH